MTVRKDTADISKKSPLIVGSTSHRLVKTVNEKDWISTEIQLLKVLLEKTKLENKMMIKSLE